MSDQNRQVPAGAWPDCGCTDGTDPDEPADRGFICPHDPRGVQAPPEGSVACICTPVGLGGFLALRDSCPVHGKDAQADPAICSCGWREGFGGFHVRIQSATCRVHCPAEDRPDAQRMASHSAFMTGLGPASRLPPREKYRVERDGLGIARHLALASTPDTNYGSDDITPGDVEAAMTRGSGPVWFAWSGPKDDAVYTAITGNGPTSEANAMFFAHARDTVLALVEEVERLRRASDPSRVEVDWRTMALEATAKLDALRSSNDPVAAIQEEAFAYLGNQATDDEVLQLARFVQRCVSRHGRATGSAWPADLMPTLLSAQSLFSWLVAHGSLMPKELHVAKELAASLKAIILASDCAGLGQTSGGNGATGLEPEALPSSTTTPARGPEEAGTFPDCGCTDGTAADEPADRGFICPHDPAGHSSSPADVLAMFPVRAGECPQHGRFGPVCVGCVEARVRRETIEACAGHVRSSPSCSMEDIARRVEYLMASDTKGLEQK